MGKKTAELTCKKREITELVTAGPALETPSCRPTQWWEAVDVLLRLWSCKKVIFVFTFWFFCPTMHGQQPNPQVLTTLLLQQDEPSPTSSPECHLWATDVTPLCKGNLQPKITSPVAQKVLIFHLSSQFCGVSFFFSFFFRAGGCMHASTTFVCIFPPHLLSFFPHTQQPAAGHSKSPLKSLSNATTYCFPPAVPSPLITAPIN